MGGNTRLETVPERFWAKYARHAYRCGVATQKEMAAKYGVSRGVMSAAIQGKAWKHVEMPQ